MPGGLAESWRALACVRGVPPWFVVARASVFLSSVAVRVVLVALDVLIDDLSDHVGQVTLICGATWEYAIQYRQRGVLSGILLGPDCRAHDRYQHRHNYQERHDGN